MLGMMIYAVCGTLTAAGLWFAMRSFRKRRFATGLRTASVALLPMGLAMTGVVKLVVNMTVNPIAWMGFGVVGFSVLLFVIARLVEGNGGGGEEAPAPGTEVARAADAPALPQPKRAAAAKPGKASGGEDFSDIEDILKRHGI